jgi:hypothetical protein
MAFWYRLAIEISEACCTPSRKLRNLPCYARVSVDPPRSSNTCLAIEYAELVESKLLLQLASHSNAGSSRSNNDDGIVGVRIFLVAVHSPYRFGDHCDA